MEQSHHISDTPFACHLFKRESYLFSHTVKMMKQFILATLIILISSNTLHANEDLQQKMQNPENWASWGGNYQGTRYSELDQINADNVKNLEVVWQVPIDVEGGYEGGPLVIGDTIYVHSPFPTKIIALDQNDRSVKWTYQSKLKPKDIPRCITYDYSCYYHANQGLAYGEGKLFLYDADTTLVALDAQTGKTLWRVKNGDTTLGASAKSAPLVVNDKVIVGINGDSYGLRGYITAYYIKDGSLAWRGYSMGPDNDMLVDPEKTQTWQDGKMQSVGKNASTKSWQDEQWQHGGGSPSGWITYDPELNLIYYGTGAPAPAHPIQRPGDNRWSSSLFARDADTGLVKWVYQVTPHNQWDYKATNESILIDQEINGKQRKTLVHFDHNGFVYVLDRQTGELLKADNFAEADWATEIDLKSGFPQVIKERSPEVKSGQPQDMTNLEDRSIGPSKYGGKPAKPSAYSPRSGLFYLSSNLQKANTYLRKVKYTLDQKPVMTREQQDDWIAYYDDDDWNKAQMGYYGNIFQSHHADAHSYGGLTAWNIATAKRKWRVKEPYALLSGVLTTTGDLVIYGTQEGYLKVLDANTGDVFYQHKTPSGIIGHINTWQFNGHQYIGVLSGLGSSPFNFAYEDRNCDIWVDGYPDLLLRQTEQDLCTQNKNGTFTVFSLPSIEDTNVSKKSTFDGQ